MKKELFYIKGSKNNPEGVKNALLKKYPNSNCTNAFNDDCAFYFIDAYYNSKGVDINSDMGRFLVAYGAEIFPMSEQEFEEKIMFQPIFKMGKTGVYGILSDTPEEALNFNDFVIGYREVKVKLLKK